MHALVQYRDGGVIAHLGAPDMRHAIGHALNWPTRQPLPVAPLDLAQIGGLTFRAPEEQRHRPLWLARQVMAEGGLMGAVFNGAKEAALDGFIARKIGFLQMAQVVEQAMTGFIAAGAQQSGVHSLDTVNAADALARRLADQAISQLTG